jgi:hypothetical protein
VGGFMADELHKPFIRIAFDIENDFLLKLPQPVVHEEKRREYGWNTYRHGPFVADVTRSMKDQTFFAKALRIVIG